MKILYVMIWFMVILMAVFGCSSPEVGLYRDISPSDAKGRLDSGEEIILLDVRTREENEEIRIPGSLLVPLAVLEEEALLRMPDKNIPVFIYCRSGQRSITAAEILLEMGYRNVYNLGGIIDWPYETESGR